jgi:transcriptional antiterminator RfaH
VEGILYLRSSGWAVAHTQPHAEHIALTNLARQGFDAFAPKFREVFYERGRKYSKSGYLFSRYIFVWIESQWSAITGTRGVSRLFLINDKPAFLNEIDEARILGLRRSLGHDGFLEMKEPPPHKIGDTIEVRSGPFYGFKGIYQGQSKEEREIVLLDMLGRSVKVELKIGEIA